MTRSPPTYKAGRPATPEPLVEQIELIRRLVETLGVPVVDAEGYEADDVIATLATELAAEGHEVVIVTGDRDAYQLVRDPLVKVLYNRRGVTDYVLYDEAGIEERTGVRPELYPFLASLRGDPSDNLPGVPGVGEKTAAKLVNAYGDVDTLYAHLDEQTPKLRASLAEHEAPGAAQLSDEPLVRDVPLDVRDRGPHARPLRPRGDAQPARPAGDPRAPGSDLQAARPPGAARQGIPGACGRLGWRRTLRAARSGAAGAAGRDRRARCRRARPASWLDVVGGVAGPVAVEAVWAAPPGRSALEGLAFAALDEPRSPAPSKRSRSRVGRTASRPLVVGWLERRAIGEPGVAEALQIVLGVGPGGAPRIVAHRAKELMRALEPQGVHFTGLDLDTAVAAYLLDAREGQASSRAWPISCPRSAPGGRGVERETARSSSVSISGARTSAGSGEAAGVAPGRQAGRDPGGSCSAGWLPGSARPWRRPARLGCTRTWSARSSACSPRWRWPGSPSTSTGCERSATS